MNTVISEIVIVPEGGSIISEQATAIRIEDEAAGPFIEIHQMACGKEDVLRFDIEEWPYIVKAVGKLLKETKKLQS